jgi:RNA polymerase sigma factor (sigma-70 family)
LQTDEIAREPAHGSRASPDSECSACARQDLDDRRLSIVLALPQRRRMFVLLRFLRAKSTSEVAAILGCSEGTVKATLHQARRWCRARDPAEQDVASGSAR